MGTNYNHPIQIYVVDSSSVGTDNKNRMQSLEQYMMDNILDNLDMRLRLKTFSTILDMHAGSIRFPVFQNYHFKNGMNIVPIGLPEPIVNINDPSYKLLKMYGNSYISPAQSSCLNPNDVSNPVILVQKEYLGMLFNALRVIDRTSVNVIFNYSKD